MSDIDIALKELDEKLNGLSGHVDEIEKRLNFMGQTTMDPVLLMSERQETLEQKVKSLTDFCRMQCEINNALRYLVRRKYTEKELNEAMEEFNSIEKKLKNDKNEEKN
jgi:adenylosuccinate lyase